MIKAYCNILAMLFLSWGIYGYCQEDKVLPAISAIAAVLTLLLRTKSSDSRYQLFEKLPLSGLIAISFLAGLFWRFFLPIVPLAQSPFPEFTAALQSGSVVAAVLIWLKPFSKENIYRLFFCAWLTVALSINVPFSSNMLIIFSLFCFAGVCVVILYTRDRPSDKKYSFLYARDFVVYSVVLVMLTTGLFIAASRVIVAVESAFFETMTDYILPRSYTHFLRISSQLNLISPGTSSLDRRPVIEATVPKGSGSYLKMQIFADYKNGTWQELKDDERAVLPSVLVPDDKVGKISMFTFFKDIIPVPEGVSAVKSKSPHWRTKNQLVYAKEDRNMRVLEFSLAVNKKPVELSDEEYKRYTFVPPGILAQLKEISDGIVDKNDDNRTKANKLSSYLRTNFAYSLDVDFSADDRGLLRMLREKRPAYCTYFATALALLLRSQGIPARVAAGFLMTEVINPKTNTYLVRVNNAHAWTEVYAPMLSFESGKTIMLWRRIDATPVSSVRDDGKKSGFFDWELFFEKIWIGILRFSAGVASVDKDQWKFYMIVGLVVVVGFLNRQRIISWVLVWSKNRKICKKVVHQAGGPLKGIYNRYERECLKGKYQEQRAPSDTDKDVLSRLRKRPDVSGQNLERIEKFISAFHSARFGGNSPRGLKELLDQILN